MKNGNIAHEYGLVPEEPNITKLPPHALESEQGILGSILISPRESIDQCTELGVTADWFYDLRHRTLWEAFWAMDCEVPKRVIDLITTQQFLKDRGELEAIGGLVYLSNLMDAVPSAAHIGWYIAIVKDKHIARKAMEIIRSGNERCMSEEEPPDQIISDIHHALTMLGSSKNKNKVGTIKEAVVAVIDRMEQQFKGGMLGLSTGYKDLDRITNGMKVDDLIIVAGRPSMGKTSLAMCIGENVAGRMREAGSNECVVVFSCEMTRESLVARMISKMAGVDISKIGPHTTEGEHKKIMVATVKVSHLTKFLIIDDTCTKISQIEAKARHYKNEQNCKLFIVDYLQKIDSGLKSTDNGEREVALVASKLKDINRELKVPLIAVAQLNRNIENGKGRVPVKSDLRGSGQIEQDADIIGVLYQPDAHKMTREQEEQELRDGSPREVHLRIVKQRNGPSGIDVRFMFFPQFTSFTSLTTRISAGD